MSKFAPVRAVVIKNRRLSGGYYSLKFGPCSRVAQCRPGQFVHVLLPDSSVYFRRAMSLAAVDPRRQEIEIISKIFGRGTAAMARCREKSALDVLGPLGRPFKPPRKGETVALVGGGVGFPPLLFLATRLIADGYPAEKIEFFYGGRTADEIVERGRIKALGVKFRPVTDDGSFGARGLVTEAVDEYVRERGTGKLRLYACGPEAMLKAADELARRHGIPGQLSLEAHMPCGFGVCLGCVVPLRAGGHARVCAEGPVFDIGEVAL